MKTRMLLVILMLSTVSAIAQIKVLSNGKVGIGNTNPSHRLVVQSNSAESNLAVFSNSTTYQAGIWLLNNSYGYWLGTGSNNTLVLKHNYNNPTSILTIQYGKLAIGTSTINTNSRINILPEYDKQAYSVTHYSGTDYVSSSITFCSREFTKNHTVNYSSTDKFFVYGNGAVCTAWGLWNFSDLSLKENISPITDAMSKINNLRGVEYRFKKDSIQNSNDTITYISPDENPMRIGLIAQEVESILPEVVMTLSNGIKTVNYEDIVALLIEAIKEQNQHIQQLETTINECCISNDTKNTGNINSDNDKFNSANKKPALFQNTPNPFNKNTTIRYFIPENVGASSLLVFDMQGKLVKTYPVTTKGDGAVEINASELQPGMYMYSLITGGKEIDTKKMILTE